MANAAPNRRTLFFWVTFETRQAGTIEAVDADEALLLAGEHGNPTDARRIPYPADPRLAVESACPSFCYQPETCSRNGRCAANALGRSCSS